MHIQNNILPDELWVQVFLLLRDVRKVVRIGSVCRYWYQLTHNDKIWSVYCKVHNVPEVYIRAVGWERAFYDTARGRNFDKGCRKGLQTYSGPQVVHVYTKPDNPYGFDAYDGKVCLFEGTSLCLRNRLTKQRLFRTSLQGERRRSSPHAVCLDRERIAVAQGTDIRVWEWQTKQEMPVVECAVGSPDRMKKSVPICFYDNDHLVFTKGSRVYITSLTPHSNVTQCQQHSDNINFICVDSVQERLYSGANCGTIKLWDLEASKEVRHFEMLGGHVQQLGVVANSLTALSTNETVTRWDCRTQALIEQPRSIPHYSNSCLFVGETYISALEGMVFFYHLPTWALLGKRKLGNITQIAVDQQALVFCNRDIHTIMSLQFPD